MAQEFASSFYKTKAWKQCRAEYAKQASYLCEKCLANGLIRPGEIVHHIIPLTPENIQCPEIALDFKNLRLLCRECHAAEHNEKLKQRRYIVEPGGKILAVDEIRAE